MPPDDSVITKRDCIHFICTFYIVSSCTAKHSLNFTFESAMSRHSRYITILPSIHLSKLISPDDVLAQRHPLEAKTGVSLDAANDKQRLAQAPNQSQGLLAIMRHRLTLYPRTNTEFILTLLLGFASSILLTYALMMLYKVFS